MTTLLVTALTWAAWPGAGEETSLSPLWIRLVVPPGGELVTGLGTVALALAGQLALLIGWGRARSQIDYAGQYRTWTRAGGACWLFAFVSRLGLDAEWRDWALSRNWPRFWNDTELLVLLPTLLAGAALGAGLRREVARCQPSRTLLMLSTTLYLTVVALKLGSGSALSTAQRLLVIENGMLAAHLTLLLCFWIHARHVLYESCDPVGESRHSPWLQAPHWLVSWRPRATWPGPSERQSDALETTPLHSHDSRQKTVETDQRPEPSDREERLDDSPGAFHATTLAAAVDATDRHPKRRGRRGTVGTAEQSELEVAAEPKT
ncbi:MAG: hypothetical protein ACK5TO_19300, partial [Planctomycetaceae bacterium]